MRFGGEGVQNRRCYHTLEPWRPVMDADLDTLATALYVTCDDLLKNHPE
jgi:hypothetical protein